MYKFSAGALQKNSLTKVGDCTAICSAVMVHFVPRFCEVGLPSPLTFQPQNNNAIYSCRSEPTYQILTTRLSMPVRIMHVSDTWMDGWMDEW